MPNSRPELIQVPSESFCLDLQLAQQPISRADLARGQWLKRFSYEKVRLFLHARIPLSSAKQTVLRSKAYHVQAVFAATHSPSWFTWVKAGKANKTSGMLVKPYFLRRHGQKKAGKRGAHKDSLRGGK